jgi:hypothetical protein
MSDDLVGRIMAFESGEMKDAEALALFSDLVKDGTIAELQGSYGRFAALLVENGFLTPEGEITDHARDTLDLS